MMQYPPLPYLNHPFRGMGGMMPTPMGGFPNQMPPHAAHHQVHHAAHHHMAHQPAQTQQMNMPAHQGPFSKRPNQQMQAQMPPPSNYVAPDDNPEFRNLHPGESKVMKGYGNRPITDKGRTLMETYERVMARPQGSFPSFGQGRENSKKECHFFNTPAGCRNGNNCAFAHNQHGHKGGRKTKCRNFPNCKFGNKCRFLHGH